MSRLNKSWDRPRGKDIHSPEGVEELRQAVKDGLTRFYIGIAETMFSYDFPDENCKDMLVMSQDTVPEQWLLNNGKATFFMLEGQLQCLPLVYADQGINIYGKIAGWSPIPYGYHELRGARPALWDRIASMKLDPSNAVIIKNDLHGRGDLEMIDAMVSTLVDNVLTLNQLQLIASQPFVFNVTEDNVLTAKNYFLALSKRVPAIFINAMGDKPMPALERNDVKIDPALFDLFDRFECILLTYLGFPCVPISKRAQQSVSEVQSNDAKLYARRQEKLLQRQRAIERVNGLFGTSIAVHSVIDELAERAALDANGTEDGPGSDGDENDEQ